MTAILDIVFEIIVGPISETAFACIVRLGLAHLRLVSWPVRWRRRRVSAAVEPMV